MGRFLRSTAIAVVLGFFLPLPGPETIFVYKSLHAAPYRGAIPDWIAASCCGPQDSHRLTMAQVQEVDGAEALRQRPNANRDTINDQDSYYIIEGYDWPLNSRSPQVNPHGVSSHDQYAWAFYREASSLNSAGSPYSVSNGQSGVYCLFLPEEF